MVEIGFLDNRTIYFTHFWKNISLFKALLLGNPAGRLLPCLVEYLLGQHAPAFLKLYRKLRKHMEPEDVAGVESLLFFNSTFHSLPLDPAQLAYRAPLPDSELDRYP